MCLELSTSEFILSGIAIALVDSKHLIQVPTGDFPTNTTPRMPCVTFMIAGRLDCR